MKEWEPIVKQVVLEPFVDEEQTNDIVGNVFITVSLMILAIFIALLFYWSYQKSVSLFITILSALVFVFSVKMVILIAVIRKKLNTAIFKVYMGSTVFMAILSLMNIIYFAIRVSNSRSTSSRYASSSMPSQSYSSSSTSGYE